MVVDDNVQSGSGAGSSDWDGGEIAYKIVTKEMKERVEIED